MIAHALTLPYRESKPRTEGLTILIDNGVPTGYFMDVVASMSEHIDFVKFGWGTSIVSPDLFAKVESLKRHNVGYFFGGTLFEKFYLQGKLDDYLSYCRHHGCSHVEISNGTIALSNRDKAGVIENFAKEFTVFSEVGFKDNERSLNLHPARWIEYIKEDLRAGAAKIITEARESGKSGICRSDGEVRYGLMEEIFEAVDLPNMIFEAPNKDLQTYFIKRLGPQVNLANVAFGDAIQLETLRLGLRSDTLLSFEVKPAARSADALNSN